MDDVSECVTAQRRLVALTCGRCTLRRRAASRQQSERCLPRLQALLSPNSWVQNNEVNECFVKAMTLVSA